MPTYTRRDATGLYKELQEILKKLPDTIERTPDDGAVMKIICEGLGTAIAALKTTIR